MAGEGIAVKVSPLAGKPAEPAMLVNVPKLVTAYYAETPDASVPEQRVAFGTSGHRGSAINKAFNEWHILAISQAICLYRAKQKIAGPLFLGMDTLQRCGEVTEEVLRTVFHQLYAQRVTLEGMILKPNMVLPGLNCPKQEAVDEVADATVRRLLRAVPAAVPGIAFLSGGQGANWPRPV